VTRRRRTLLLAGALLSIALGVGLYFLHALVLVGAAYQAKMLCSGVFLAGRDPADVAREDITADHPVLRLIRAHADRERHSASAGLFGLREREAVFRDGLGCTLAIGVDAERLRADVSTPGIAAVRDSVLPWPNGEAVPSQSLSGANALRRVVDAAFDEPDPEQPRRTRAVIVVQDGRIVAERYAPGFGPDTRQIGWSMTKSVTAALVGILVGQGKLALDRPAPVAEWRRPGDPRGAITLDQLLRMTSGLAFIEDYTAGFSDVVFMLFASADMAAYAAGRPLMAPPGSTWSYATGTTNILARIVHDAAGTTPEARHAFPRRALFDRIGMTSAVIELDPSGTFVGSAFMYASARDWARFGLLTLQDGAWNGERILPAGWVAYSRRATPPPPPGAADFGAHLWLRVPDPYYRQSGARPALPADAFHVVGHHAQFISVIPSRRLVVVRLGLSAPWAWDQETFLDRLLQALPASRQ